MRVTLEYGRSGLDVELPDASVVRTLSYKSADPLADISNTRSIVSVISKGRAFSPDELF